jgi:hypothetical protein
MVVLMPRGGMAAFTGMGVEMEMHQLAMPMAMEMHPLADHPPQDIGPEHDQHRADQSLQPMCQSCREGVARGQHQTSHRQKRQAVPQPPGGAQSYRLAKTPAARCQRGHGSHMVGLQRVAHAD